MSTTPIEVRVFEDGEIALYVGRRGYPLTLDEANNLGDRLKAVTHLPLARRAEQAWRAEHPNWPHCHGH